MVTRVDSDVADVLEHVMICHHNHPDTFEECVRDNIIMRFGTIPLDEAVGTVSKVIGKEPSLTPSQKNVLWQEYIASMNRKGLMDNNLAEHLRETRNWIR